MIPCMELPTWIIWSGKIKRMELVKSPRGERGARQAQYARLGAVPVGGGSC